MLKSDMLALLSHIINFGIIINFTIFLIKIDVLNSLNLSINAFGLFASLISNIYSVIERNKMR